MLYERGDEMAQKALCADGLDMISKYSGTVYRMAYSLLKHKQDAEDIHQEVFLKYLGKKPAFKSEEHAKAWFLRVTVNLCKNHWKTAWRQKVVGFADADFAEAAEEKTDELIGIVWRLPQKYRIVIHLFYYEDLSVGEISQILGTKPSTVRAQLTRARGKLRELLEEV